MVLSRGGGKAIGLKQTESGAMKMSVQSAQVARFYSDIWNLQDRSQLPGVLHEDFTFRGSLGMEKRGHDEFWSYVEFVTAALDNYECVIQDLVEQGNRVFARMLFQGIHRAEFMGVAATGRQVEWAGAALFTFRENRVADLWVLGDVDGLKQQLKADV